MNFPQCETVPTTAATNSNSSSKENKLNSCYHQPISNNRNLIQQKLSSPPSPVSSGVTQFEHKREVETKFCISTPPSKSIRSSLQEWMNSPEFQVDIPSLNLMMTMAMVKRRRILIQRRYLRGVYKRISKRLCLRNLLSIPIKYFNKQI
jgi:hypothetical protein